MKEDLSPSPHNLVEHGLPNHCSTSTEHLANDDDDDECGLLTNEPVNGSLKRYIVKTDRPSSLSSSSIELSSSESSSPVSSPSSSSSSSREPSPSRNQSEWGYSNLVNESTVPFDTDTRTVESTPTPPPRSLCQFADHPLGVGDKLPSSSEFFPFSNNHSCSSSDQYDSGPDLVSSSFVSDDDNYCARSSDSSESFSDDDTGWGRMTSQNPTDCESLLDDNNNINEEEDEQSTTNLPAHFHQSSNGDSVDIASNHHDVDQSRLQLLQSFIDRAQLVNNTLSQLNLEMESELSQLTNQRVALTNQLSRQGIQQLPPSATSPTVPFS